MKKIILIILCLLTCSSVMAGELKTIILDTGPYLCAYKRVNVHELVWTNDGPPIKIKSSVIWIGVDRGGVGDISAYLYKASTGDVINSFGWDHYKNPSGPHQVTKDFGQDYITIETGDSLSLQYFCDATPRDCHAHVGVWIWYITD